MVSGNGSPNDYDYPARDPDDEHYNPESGMPNHDSLVNLDRDRGILTPADRRMLVGEAEYESGSNSERKARHRVRQRIREAMRDFYLLLNYLDERDLKRAFKQDGPERVLHDDVISVFPAALGFLYAASTAHPDDGVEIFEARLNQGIVAAEVTRKNSTASVEVDIKVDREESLEQLAELVREEGADAPVNSAELDVLLEKQMIDTALYGEVMQSMLQGEH